MTCPHFRAGLFLPGTVVGVSELLRFTVEYEPPDETGAIVARVREVPSALSFGHTREEARANVLDALRLMLSPEPGAGDEDTLDFLIAS